MILFAIGCDRPPILTTSDADMLAAPLDGEALDGDAGTCTASCSGRDCGDDGCGGSCGACNGTCADGVCQVTMATCDPKAQDCGPGLRCVQHVSVGCVDVQKTGPRCEVDRSGQACSYPCRSGCDCDLEGFYACGDGSVGFFCPYARCVAYCTADADCGSDETCSSIRQAATVGPPMCIKTCDPFDPAACTSPGTACMLGEIDNQLRAVCSGNIDLGQNFRCGQSTFDPTQNSCCDASHPCQNDSTSCVPIQLKNGTITQTGSCQWVCIGVTCPEAHTACFGRSHAAVCDCVAGYVRDPNGACVCARNCVGHNCGDDGCGGSCGTCSPQQTCSAGSCICKPNCLGKACGSDGCGGSCGACGLGLLCSGGACVADPNACDPVTNTGCVTPNQCMVSDTFQCALPGAGVQDGPCSAIVTCAGGFGCFGGTCRKICLTATGAGCPPGYQCNGIIGSAKYGACAKM